MFAYQKALKKIQTDSALIIPTLSLICTCLIAAASPISGWLAINLGFDPFRLVGTVHTISSAKVKLFWQIAGVLTGTSIIVCLASIKDGLRSNLLVGLVVTAAIPAPILSLQTALHPKVTELIEKYTWQEISLDSSLYAWEPEGALRLSLKSFEDARVVAKTSYSRAEDHTLNSISQDSLVRYAIYLSVIVSRWWGPGNKYDRTRVGCVRQSEYTQHSAISEELTDFALYKNSDIACCDDYSHLLKYLLDGEGIPNRIVMAAGHAFNEATIGGRSYVFDSMNAMVVFASWDDVNRGVARAKVLLLPLASARPGSRTYRATAAAERMRLLLLLIAGGYQTRYIDRLPGFIS